MDLHASSFGRSTSRTAELLGGKGANLARLTRAGFPIPRGFCLTTTAYREVVEQGVLAARPLVTSQRELVERLATAELPGSIGQALADAYAELKSDDGLPRLAVRSSATGEDSAEASHAGQAATFLNVAGFEALLEAVRGCWSSLWSEDHLAYRHRPARPQNGLVIKQAPAMAVVIQEMVPAQAAGVMFTCNPVTGSAEQMVISAAWGLGETVVAGGAADTFTVDRRGRVLRRDVAQKVSLIEQHPDGGTCIRTVAPAEAHRPCIPDTLLPRLAALGRAVERCLGGPQDIEWAVVDGRLFLLQARPITASGEPMPVAVPQQRQRAAAAATLATDGLRSGGRPAGGAAARPVVWSNVNVGEALPGVATPMTWSMIEGFSRRGFVQAFGALGLEVPAQFAMVGNFHGRVYLNLSEFMSVASGIPFLTPRILARLAGGVDARLLEGAYSPASPVRFLGRLPGSLLRMASTQLLAPRQARAHACRFRAARDRFLEQDLATKSWKALHAQLLQLQELFVPTGELLLTCSSNALASYIAVQLLLAAGGEPARRLEADLFTGLEGLASAAPGLRLLELARLAQELKLADLFTGQHADDGGLQQLAALAARPSAAPFLEAFSIFLGEFGHRAVREAELSVPRWREDPSFPLQVIARHLAAADLPDPRERQARQAQARLAATAEALRLLPAPFRPLLERLLPMAQEAARLREMLRACVTEALGLHRYLLLEVGQRLVRQEMLARTDDVFFLTIGEVEQMLADRPQPLVARVMERRARFEADLLAPELPATFRTGPALATGSGRSTAQDGPAASAAARRGEVLLQGLGCSAGQVEGVVRVLGSPAEGQRLQPGDILVAHTTDMGWSPLFLVASGLVLDLNGPLSHAAVVAREYGLPVVVNTGNATQVLHDGDRVLLDGREGTVKLVARAPLPAAKPATRPDTATSVSTAARVA